jgi:FKBP-type peptidyl-prolyl cis-trans isomerase
MTRVLTLSVLTCMLASACGNSREASPSSTTERPSNASSMSATSTPGATPAPANARTVPPIPGATPLPVADRTPPADAVRQPSGLVSKVITAGTGTERPRAFDRVTFNFTGWSASDGQMFDNTERRGQPLTLVPSQVMPGWTEGLQLMVAGEKRRFWIPESMTMERLPRGTIVFDIELVSVERMPDPPATPADVAAAPADATCTASGLCSKILSPGTGTARPAATDTVRVHYTGWKTDGTLFDSSVQRGEPAEFPLNGVIPGWTEGVALMRVGEKRRFWIPEALAYGGQREPRGMLVFDVELLAIVVPPAPPTTPPDVAAAPRNAPCTTSGICSRVITRGTGTAHPTATSRVRVHYSGWTTDGQMFDSSVTRGEPAEFPLNGVIPGWTEGVQLMVVGEKRRFWIPEALAYRGQRPPLGMLVFDVELIAILD